jgi:nucleotide-binding universal stress UspA family protein
MDAKKILVPIDFSPSGDAALKLAEALARDSGASLLLLHVDETPRLMYGGEFFDVGPVPFNDEIWQRLNDIRLSDPSLVCECHMETGSPVEEIVRLANEEQVDFIVMGTHGRRGLTRALLGSIAEGVMRRAPCPVITLKQTPVPNPSLANSSVAITGSQ